MSGREKSVGYQRIGPEGVREFFSSFSPGVVVDLGCGDGGFLKTVLDALPSFTAAYGIDPSDAAIKAASALFAEDIRVSFMEASAERVPLKDGVAGLAVMSYSLHHIERPAAALAEAKRILISGGALALQDFVDEDLTPEQRLREEYHALRGDVDRAAGGYMRPIYQAKEIDTLLLSAGFAHVRSYRVDAPIEPGKEAAPRLRAMLEKELGRVGDARARAAILERAEGVLARIEASVHARPPSYLAEWRTQK